MKVLPMDNKLHTHGGDCQSENVVYAAWCRKHKVTYVGQTGEKLSRRFSKHRYDILHRPSNSELAGHFHKDHDLDKDLGIVLFRATQKQQ